MKNNLRNLISIPALAIAAMAVTATNADAQCPGGCFGYPTPSQPVFQSYAPAVQYQAVQYQAVNVVPVQSFVQPQVFAAPAFIPAQPLVQPQTIIAPQQIAPVAPIQQTFVSQPAMVDSAPAMSMPMQTSYPGLPANAFNVQPILPMQSGMPVQQSLPMVSPLMTPVDTVPADAMEKSVDEVVEEGQIEGEVISPADDASGASVMKQDSSVDVPLAAAAGLSAEEEKAAMEKAAMEKAEMERVAKEKAEMKKSMERKAAMERAAKRKAAKEKAAKEKAANKKPEAKELTNEERIAKLETSLKRQVKRAEQVSKQNLTKKLDQLAADDAADAKIEAAKEASAAALKKKLAEIEKRVKARIELLKK